MKCLKLSLASGLLLCSTVGLTAPALADQPTAAPGQRVLLTQGSTQPQERMRIAVLDFDFASTGTTYRSVSFFRLSSPEKGVSDLLTNELVGSGRFTMVERSRIDAILQEQNLGLSGRVDAATAAEVGRILGVDAVIVGSITRFNLGSGSSGVNLGPFSVGGGNRNAEVALSARLINTTTAEILSVAEGSGTATEGGGSVRLGRVGGSTDSRNEDALLSNAANDAVADLAKNILAAAPGSPASAASPVSAVVADVDGNTVILNRGSRDGFQAGMVVSIERVDREVTDPNTGRVLRTITTSAGRVELTDVDSGSSIGTIVQGTGIQVGDRAVIVP